MYLFVHTWVLQGVGQEEEVPWVLCQLEQEVVGGAEASLAGEEKRKAVLYPRHS